MPDLIDTPDARLISDNTFELMTYLKNLYDNNIIQPANTPENTTFVYHMPCHMYPISTDPPAVELTEKLLSARTILLDAGCCGLAGTYGMQKKNAELSEKISQNLRDAVNKLNVDSVLTECAACKMQIEHLTGKKVIHPVKILAKACGLL